MFYKNSESVCLFHFKMLKKKRKNYACLFRPVRESNPFIVQKFYSAVIRILAGRRF